MIFHVNNPTRTKNHRRGQAQRNDFFKVFDGIFGNEFSKISNNLSNVMMQPPVNITEAEESYTLELSVPGWNKEDFEVNVEDKFLTISATIEKEPTTEEKATDTVETTRPNYLKREFRKRSFSRTFTLSDKSNADAIDATYENGILTINIAKLEEAKPVKKVVEIS